MEERYSRQIRFKQIGEEGQKRLADSHVLIVGAGALGTAGAEGLSRAESVRLPLLTVTMWSGAIFKGSSFIQKAMPNSACRKPWLPKSIYQRLTARYILRRMLPKEQPKRLSR